MIFFDQLLTSPLFHLVLTLAAFAIGVYLFQKSKMMPLVNPVLTAMIIIMSVLHFLDIEYDTYFSAVQFIHFLLGPATVALAVPLYRQLRYVKQSASSILIGLLCGSIASVASAVLVAYALGASNDSIVSLVPKSVTSPIAMGIAEELGGIPSLTAALVIITGVLGSIIAVPLFNWMKIKNWSTKGIAMGTACHGVGTASIMLQDEKAGAFSGLAMGLNGILSAILIPIFWRIFS